MATRLETDMAERRVFMRRLTNARVKLVHGTIGAIQARTRDISDNGVFIECYPVPKLPVGAHIKMHMLDSSSPDIAFNMKVVRTTGDGIGMIFIDFEQDGERYTIDVLRKRWAKKNKKR